LKTEWEHVGGHPFLEVRTVALSVSIAASLLLMLRFSLTANAPASAETVPKAKGFPLFQGKSGTRPSQS
jgi:hypothetical protein